MSPGVYLAAQGLCIWCVRAYTPAKHYGNPSTATTRWLALCNLLCIRCTFQIRNNSQLFLPNTEGCPVMPTSVQTCLMDGTIVYYGTIVPKLPHCPAPTPTPTPTHPHPTHGHLLAILEGTLNSIDKLYNYILSLSSDHAYFPCMLYYNFLCGVEWHKQAYPCGKVSGCAMNTRGLPQITHVFPPMIYPQTQSRYSTRKLFMTHNGGTRASKFTVINSWSSKAMTAMTQQWESDGKSYGALCFLD